MKDAVFGHGASHGEDRKSLSAIVSEFHRGCKFDFFFRPSWATYGPNRDKSQNGTVFDHAESIGEDRKSLSLIVSEFQRGCSWIPYANIW